MSPAQERKNHRRKEILAAAFECFIQYGHGKTTFEDVAGKAGVSRSLLYAYFEDKEDLFLAVAQDVLAGQRQKTEAVLDSGSAERDKFGEILDLWGVDLYAKVADSPHGGELLGEGYRAWEVIGAKYREYLIQVLARFVGSADVSEILVLCLKGLQGDRPSVPVLRKRTRLLEGLSWKRRARP